MTSRGNDTDLAVLGAAPLTPDDPERVGRFRLLGVLGTGGMGRVYLGWADGRLVAVKVIRPELADNQRFRRRFAHELEAVGRLRTDFTAPLVDAGPDAGRPWMATGYVPGPSLDRVVTDSPDVLSRAAVWRLAVGTATALAAIHDTGIVHRDLKPSNVILALDGPKVIDFGVAHAAGLSNLTVTGQTVGTPAYMAPEQARTGSVGPASDVFALGGLLVFAATGRPPFGEGSPTEVLFRVVHEPPDLTALRAFDHGLHTLVERCFSKDPQLRPTAAEVAAAAAGYPVTDWPAPLRGLIEPSAAMAGRVSSAEPPAPVMPGLGASAGDTPALPRHDPEPAPPRRRRRAVTFAVAGVLLAAGAGVAADLALGHQGSPQPVAEPVASPAPSTSGPTTTPSPSGSRTSHPPKAVHRSSAPPAPPAESRTPVRTVTAKPPATTRTVRPPAPVTAKPPAPEPTTHPWDNCDMYTGTAPTVRGDQGSHVVEVQCLLQNRAYNIGPKGQDGDFGVDTFTAVEQFQTDHGLEVDGQVGPQTWGALRSEAR